jgi:tRNA pseudouridine38-40 synthase
MRYKLTIEYDGSRYAGWQLQKNARSIQGELIEKASHIFNTNQLELYGAGRTDTGVHARGQVAHLDVPSRLTPEQIRMRFNDELPADINVLSVETVNPKFHARFDAKQRSYTYQISKRRDAFSKKYVWWIKDPLNTMMMRAAAAQLVGFHNFRSFGDTEKEGQSTMVEMTKVEIVEDADRIYVHIRGSHFLWKMVRRIIGVLVEVGRGNMTPDDVEHLLKIHSREPAKLTAPPSGLFLEKVEY